MNRRLLTAVMAVAALAALLAAACGGDDDDSSTPGRSTAKSGPTVAGTTVREPIQGNFPAKLRAITVPPGLASGRKLGKDDAKVKLQIYEDFRCPHCLEFTANFEQFLIDQYVKPGTVQIEFKYFPLGQASVPIMAAAQCADAQGQFWDYGRRLFLAQAEAKDATALAEAFSLASLKAYAAELKLDAAKFEACLNDDATLEPIASDYRDAQALSVRGTPSFVVNGVLQPDVPPSNAAWKKLLDDAAAK